MRFRKNEGKDSIKCEQKKYEDIFFYISVMVESQAKSREAKVNFDDDILEGEKAKISNI